MKGSNGKGREKVEGLQSKCGGWRARRGGGVGDVTIGWVGGGGVSGGGSIEEGDFRKVVFAQSSLIKKKQGTGQLWEGAKADETRRRKVHAALTQDTVCKRWAAGRKEQRRSP